jgi:hypothetical protein
MKWKDFKVSEDGLTYTARLEAAGSIPLVAAARLVGDLDYEGDLRIDLVGNGESAVVSFDGKVDAFPAYEMYVSADDGPPKNCSPNPRRQAQLVLTLWDLQTGQSVARRPYTRNRRGAPLRSSS